MPSGKHYKTTAGSQVDAQQTDEKVRAEESWIDKLPHWFLLLTLDQAREIARTSLERWNEIAASGDSDAETLAVAEAIAVSAAVSVQQIEKFLKGEVRSLVLENDVPHVAPMPTTQQ